MKRRTLIKGALTILPTYWISKALGADSGIEAFEFAKVPFKSTWESLKNYKTPEWYKNAKFGIWAHWGPQCQPERGDWYARKMYHQGSEQYNFHIEKYGHPSEFGFKDVINEWKAENWKPDDLVSLYKNAGAQYFVALANHHDNLDLYDSKYQSWNSLKVGPKKDIIKGWADAAKKSGLKFGVSVHAAHAWRWFESSQMTDKTGAKAGVPYDGKPSKDMGNGKWWEGLDPQDLYAQKHELSLKSDDPEIIHQQWNWNNGCNIPDDEYNQQFLKRTLDLVKKYNPDLIYFDDTAFPLWPISDVGLEFASFYYNKSNKSNGSTEVVINGKILDQEQRKAMVWDIERGQSNNIEPLPWQTCTCIGRWHYDRRIFENKGYKSAKTIVHTLADVVSKNGNLLLSVPLRGDGSIDSLCKAVVEEIGDWMRVNQEGILNTRPWKVFGEGPALEAVVALDRQGFNEGKGKPFGPQDIRFTTSGNNIYAIAMGWPENGVLKVKSMGKNSPHITGNLKKVNLLGFEKDLAFNLNDTELEIKLPKIKLSLTYAYVIKISIS